MRQFNQAVYYYRNSIFETLDVGEELLVIGNLVSVKNPAVDLNGNRIISPAEENNSFRLTVVYDVDKTDFPLTEDFIIDENMFNNMNITPNSGIIMAVVPILYNENGFVRFKVKSIINQSEELCIPMAVCNICGKFLGYINMDHFRSDIYCACSNCRKLLNLDNDKENEFDTNKQSSVTPIYYIPKSAENIDTGSINSGIRANHNHAIGLDFNGYIENNNKNMYENNVLDKYDNSPIHLTVRLEDYENLTNKG